MKLVSAKAVQAAMQELEDNFDGGLLNQAQVMAILEAAAPLIASLALKEFAQDFEDLGERVGIAPKIYMQVAAVARRAAKDIRKGKKKR